MKKDVIVLNCKKCGDEFLYEYRGSGRKPDYCPDCRKLIDDESHKAYVQKTRGRESLKVTNKVTSNDISYKNLIDNIGKALVKLDDVRVELCELSKQMNEYQSTYDRNDQNYLHLLENVDAENPAEAQKLVKEWKESRNGRRNVKGLQKIVGDILNVIPYKNYYNALPLIKGSAYKIRK